MTLGFFFRERKPRRGIGPFHSRPVFRDHFPHLVSRLPAKIRVEYTGEHEQPVPLELCDLVFGEQGNLVDVRSMV